MNFVDIFTKIGKGEVLSEMDKAYLRNIENNNDLVGSWIVPGSSIPFIRNLIAENIKIPSGEITLGTSSPSTGFSGVRIAFPAVSYGGESWNIAGVKDNVLQVGIRSSDGVLVAGGGAVRLNANGLEVRDDGTGFITFYDTGGTTLREYFAATNNGISLILFQKNLSFQVLPKMQDNSTPGMLLKEDGLNNNRLQFNIASGTNGSKITIDDSISLNGQSADNTNYANFLQMNISANTPTLTSGGNIYFRNNKLIIQWNDGGTVRYKYLDLTGTGVTWVHTTTAP